MKHIFLVIDSLVGAGAQRQITNLALGLDARGFKVSLFFYHPKYDFLDRLADSTVEIIEHNKKGKFDLKPVIRLSSEIRSRQPDIVIAYLRTPSIYCELIKVFNSNFKLIVSERLSVANSRLTLADFVAGILHFVADHVNTNSTDYRNHLVKALPFLSKKTSVIYNGAGSEFFNINRCGNKDRQGNGTVSFVAISSRCTRTKGAFVLAQAVNMLVKSGVSNFQLSWVGNVDFNDHYVETVAAYLEQNNLNAYWHWNGKSDNVLNTLKRSTVLISASFQEGVSNVICEAMAAGLPTIVSDISDNSIIVEDGASGTLYPAGNVEKLCAAMAAYCDMTPDAYTQLSKRCRRRATELFHMDSMVDQWINLCQQQTEPSD